MLFSKLRSATFENAAHFSFFFRISLGFSQRETERKRERNDAQQGAQPLPLRDRCPRYEERKARMRRKLDVVVVEQSKKGKKKNDVASIERPDLFFSLVHSTSPVEFFAIKTTASDPSFSRALYVQHEIKSTADVRRLAMFATTTTTSVSTTAAALPSTSTSSSSSSSPLHSSSPARGLLRRASLMRSMCVAVAASGKRKRICSVERGTCCCSRIG